MYVFAAAAAAAAAKSLQSCPTLCNPMDCSLQAPPSMGFSRQEYWSGLPLPSPMYVYIQVCIYTWELSIMFIRPTILKM